MILTCPQCETRYQTDPALFGADGRKVRCAKCSHVWFQSAPAPVEVPLEPRPHIGESAEPASPLTEPVQHSAYARAESTSYVAADTPTRLAWSDRLGSVLGWAGLAALVIVVGWSAIRFRQEIATVWPQSASFYAAIGKPVNTRGIKLEVLRYQNETENGQAVLAVTGRLTNITAHELSVPPIRITLTDKDRRTLYDWSFSAKVAVLRPGQAVDFATRLSNPPRASQLHAQFADNKE